MHYSLWNVVPNTLPVGDLVMEDRLNCRPKHVELIWIYQYTSAVCSSIASLFGLLNLEAKTTTFFRNVGNSNRTNSVTSQNAGR